MILLILAFLTITAYIVYAGIHESLSESYYVVKKPWLFQLTLGLTGFLMMLFLLELITDERYKFLAFTSTAALAFVAIAPNYKNFLEGRVHVGAAIVSAISSVLLMVLIGYWWIPAILFAIAGVIIWKKGNKVYWLEMCCIYGTFLLGFLELLQRYLTVN